MLLSHYFSFAYFYLFSEIGEEVDNNSYEALKSIFWKKIII